MATSGAGTPACLRAAAQRCLIRRSIAAIAKWTWRWPAYSEDFPQAFFEAYDKEWPLPEGHLQRVELYNLYHLLNHANLFGGGYWQQSAASIEALLRHGC